MEWLAAMFHASFSTYDCLGQNRGFLSVTQSHDDNVFRIRYQSLVLKISVSFIILVIKFIIIILLSTCRIWERRFLHSTRDSSASLRPPDR